MFRLENGCFHIPFKATPVATFTRWEPAVTLWAELRSPLRNPKGKGRKENIQPDYTLAIDRTGGASVPPQPAPGEVMVVVECKQYLKANKMSFKNALHDYASGHPGAQVVLVNYGPAAPSIAADLASLFNPSPEVFGGFQPECMDLARGRFESLLLRAIERVCKRKSVAPPSVGAPVDERERIPTGMVGSIRLTWSDHPVDLDLHLYLPDGAGEKVVYYRSPGALERAPWAWLAKDISSTGSAQRSSTLPGPYRDATAASSTSIRRMACWRVPALQ
jgi:hypothetical protein